MIKEYKYNESKSKLVEKILDDDNIMINHMILNKGDEMPVHNSNSNVYMIIVKGVLTIQFDDELDNKYEKGTILNIPFGKKMHIYNEDDDQVEFFVVKSPSPRLYGK